MTGGKLTKSIVALVAITLLVLGCNQADSPESAASAGVATSTIEQDSKLSETETRLIYSRAF